MEFRRSFEDIFRLSEDVINFGYVDGENIFNEMPRLPRFRKIYWRNMINPYDFYSDEEFKKRYRFNKNTVENYILPEIRHIIEHRNKKGIPIEGKTQILIALRFYATGDIQLVCAELFSVSQATVCRIINRITKALTKLVPKFIGFSGNEHIRDTITKFKELPFSVRPYNYPGLDNIIGAIDCTHVRIKRPRKFKHSEVYRNRKGYFSINVQVVVGPDMEIFNIVARWPGSAHDSRIFRSSKLCSQLKNGQLNGMLVGDSGYSSSRYLLCPFTNPITPGQHRYNYIQIRTRNVVERFFGVWKKRFGCLQRGLSNKLSTSTDIIVACAVLHNIGIKTEDLYEQDNGCSDANNIIGDPPMRATRHSMEGVAFRNAIVNRFYE